MSELVPDGRQSPSLSIGVTPPITLVESENINEERECAVVEYDENDNPLYTRWSDGKRLCKSVLMFFPVLLAVPTMLGVLYGFYILNKTKPYISNCNQYPFNGPKSPWDIRAFLTINIAGGRYQFSTVKAIDAAWNILVGRVIQLLLITLSCRAYATGAVRVAESGPIRFELFQQLTMPISLWMLFKNLLTRAFTVSKNRSRMVIYLYCALYLSAYPSLMDLVTGYVPTQDVHVKDYQTAGPIYNETWYKYGSFVRDDKFVILNNKTQYYQWETLTVAEFAEACPGSVNLREYNREILNDGKGFYDPNPDNWCSQIRPPNRTNLPLSQGYRNLLRDRDYMYGFSFNNSFYASNTTNFWNSTYYETNKSHMKCISTDNPATFSYGISLQACVLATACTGLYAWSMYILWVHAHRRSILCQAGRRVGPYRAALDLANAAKQVLKEDEESLTDFWGESELEKKLRKENVTYVHMSTEASNEIKLEVVRQQSGVEGNRRSANSGTL